MSGVLFVVMSLGAFRVWRLIARDTWPPVEWLRDQIEAATEGPTRLRPFIRDALECPWCLGAYLSAAVVAWCDYLVGLSLPLLQWAAVSAAVGLVASKLDD